MVAPVTGPFVKLLPAFGWPAGYTAAGVRCESGSRTWYRQKPPYNLPLSFTSVRSKGVWNYGSNRAPLARQPQDNHCWISNPTSSSSNAYNDAWSSFVEKVSGNASWAVTLIQYRQSYDSLVTNTTDLYHVFRDIRRGNFKALYKRFKPPKGFKTKGKTFANRVLEWRFGWQPLWNDIHESARQLGRDFDDRKIETRSTRSWTETAVYDNSGTYAHIRETRVAKYVQKVRLSAGVRITNPNLVLLNGMGLTNPLSVAYEVIPFSFVLNYFINLEEYIRGLNPFLGVELVNPCTTVFTTVNTSLSGTVIRSSYPYPNIGPYGVTLTGHDMRRSPGAIAAPKLRVRDPWILSPVRGLTSVSLLLQQLAKH